MTTLFDADAYTERTGRTPWHQGIANPRAHLLDVLWWLHDAAMVDEDEDSYEAVSCAETLIEWVEKEVRA
jgi:hypothetical protein